MFIFLFLYYVLMRTNVLDMAEIEEALLTVIMGKERKSFTQNEHAKKLTAYHEGTLKINTFLQNSNTEITNKGYENKFNALIFISSLLSIFRRTCFSSVIVRALS